MARSKWLARSVLRGLVQTMAFLVVMFALPFAPASLAGSQALAADGDAKAAAREHFQKGLTAYDDQRFGEAAEEFEAAYRLSPAFKLLYNIGQVNVALGRSVEAVDAFDKYLKQGASAIPEQRRQEVSEEIEKQRGRIGTISVRTLPGGASIRLDGALVGTTPLASALRVTAGRHVVEAALAGHAAETREISVGGRSNESLEITLEAVTTPAPPAAAVPPPAPASAPRAEHSIIEEHLVVENRGAATPAVAAPAAEAVAVPQPRSSTNWQRIVGVLITIGGVATATVGGINAYQGINQANDARDRLNTEGGAAYDADKMIFDAGKSRNERGWITAGIGAGIALGGIIVIATAPDKSSSLAFAPWTGAGGGGLSMARAF
jgi:hypothetical protein